jgi:hypothetical protein
MDEVEVCTGPSLALGPRSDPARGPGLVLVAQILFGSVPGSGLVQIIAITCFLNISDFLWPFLFRKEKAIRSCAQLMLVTQSGSGNKSLRLDFLGDFRSCPLPEIVPISLYRSSNVKITSDIPRASLNNSFKDCWHFCIKRNTY